MASYTLQNHLPTGEAAAAGVAGVARVAGVAGAAGAAGVTGVAGVAGAAGRRAGVARGLDLDAAAEPVGVGHVLLVHARGQAELFADVHVAVLLRPEAVVPVLPLRRHTHLAVLHSNLYLVGFEAAHVHRS